jgi:peroxiredoxin
LIEVYMIAHARPRIAVPLAFLLAWTPALAASQVPVQESYQERLGRLGFTVLDKPVQVEDFEVPSLGGGATKLSSQRGKVVLLNFWATWCPPCRAEMPAIESLWKKTKGSALSIMGVSVGEETATVRDFIAKNKYGYPIYLDRSGSLAGYYGASSIPMTFLIDTRGRAVAYVVGDIKNRGGKAYDSPEMIAAIEALGAAK